MIKRAKLKPMLNLKLKIFVFINLFLFAILNSGCAESELLLRYKLELQTSLNCSQTGVGMQQCVDQKSLAENTRYASWVIEKREDGNLLQPQSTFILTLENGRILSGIYFADNKRFLGNSDICKGEADHCYFARSQSTESDASLGCQKIKDKSIVFTVKDQFINGEIIVSQTSDANCGTQQSSQKITKFKGKLAEEVVPARDLGDL